MRAGSGGSGHLFSARVCTEDGNIRRGSSCSCFISINYFHYRVDSAVRSSIKLVTLRPYPKITAEIGAIFHAFGYKCQAIIIQIGYIDSDPLKYARSGGREGTCIPGHISFIDSCSAVSPCPFSSLHYLGPSLQDAMKKLQVTSGVDFRAPPVWISSGTRKVGEE